MGTQHGPAPWPILQAPLPAPSFEARSTHRHGHPPPLFLLSPPLRTPPHSAPAPRRRAYFRTKVKESDGAQHYGTIRWVGGSGQSWGGAVAGRGAGKGCNGKQGAEMRGREGFCSASCRPRCRRRIHVRRDHVFEDSFYQLRMRTPGEMKAKLRWAAVRAVPRYVTLCDAVHAGLGCARCVWALGLEQRGAGRGGRAAQQALLAPVLSLSRGPGLSPGTPSTSDSPHPQNALPFSLPSCPRCRSVLFQGEEGVDAGGVTREWYQARKDTFKSKKRAPAPARLTAHMHVPPCSLLPCRPASTNLAMRLLAAAALGAGQPAAV